MRLAGLAVLAAFVAAIVVWRLTRPTPEGDGTAMADVVVPDLSAQATLGKTLFDASCADCHGANAAGQDGVAPPLVHIIYEPSHHSDASFHLAVQNGVRAHHWSFGDMPPVEGVGEADVTAIIAHIRELQRANGIK
ncbi:MAG: cytochrome c [Roseitalea sp.]|nr:cytochrome c [Roseitalea sp.]MBO6721176.1 cytochrome c [Roseitalea sp.]MBO6744234.1 cytochrome c [Roseitalea sp.]